LSFEDESTDSFPQHINQEGYYQVPEIDQDDESKLIQENNLNLEKSKVGTELDKFGNLINIKTSNIPNHINNNNHDTNNDSDDEKNDTNNNESILETEVTQSFVPNVNEQTTDQDKLIEEFLSELPTRGEMVNDIKWNKGFFQRTFPEVFICYNNDNGGDITTIDKPIKNQKW